MTLTERRQTLADRLTQAQTQAQQHQQALTQLAAAIEQLRGAIALADELLAEMHPAEE